MNVQNDSKKTAITAALNASANIVSLIVGMIMVPVLTHVISTNDLGIATAFISSRNIMTILVTFAIYAYVNKAMLEFPKEKKSYIFSVILFCFAAITVFFVIGIFFKKPLMAFFKFDDFLFYWLFVSCFVFAIYNIGNYYCTFHNRYVIVASMVLITGTFAPVMSVVLAYLMRDHKYIGRVLGVDLGYIIVAVCVLIWGLFIGERHFKTIYIKRSLQFTAPVMPHLLSQVLLTQCDMLMINFFSGSDKAGIYSMGHTVGFLALTVIVQIMAAWSPWVYRRFEERDYANVRKNARWIVLICTYISLGLLTVSAELIRLFLAEDYRPCIYIVPPLVAATYFEFIYLFFYDILYYNKKANCIAAASIITSVLNIILNLIFIKMYGYIAACYTTVFSYLVLILIGYYFCREYKIKEIYPIRYIILWTLFVVVYAAAILLCGNFILIRYVLFGAVTVAIVVRRYRELFEMLNKFRKRGKTA